MNDFGFHDTREFLRYCEEYKIISFIFSSHITHLLQPLDVYIFQSLKHYHFEIVNETISTGDETFSKTKFLTAFNTFRVKAFKSIIIVSTWKKTDLISYNSKIVLEVVRNTLSLSRETTSKASEYTSLAETLRIIRQVIATGFELMTYSAISENL